MTIDANVKPAASPLAPAGPKSPPVRASRMRRNVRFVGGHLGTATAQIAVGVVALGLWELAGYFKLIDTFFVGKPSAMICFSNRSANSREPRPAQLGRLSVFRRRLMHTRTWNSGTTAGT